MDNKTWCQISSTCQPFILNSMRGGSRRIRKKVRSTVTRIHVAHHVDHRNFDALWDLRDGDRNPKKCDLRIYRWTDWPVAPIQTLAEGPSVQNCQQKKTFLVTFRSHWAIKFTPRQDFWAHSYISQRIPLNPLTKELDGWQGPSEFVLIHLSTIWDRFFAFCRFLSSVIQRHGYMVWTLDKPDCCLDLLLIQYLTNSTNLQIVRRQCCLDNI